MQNKNRANITAFQHFRNSKPVYRKMLYKELIKAGRKDNIDWLAECYFHLRDYNSVKDLLVDIDRSARAALILAKVYRHENQFKKAIEVCRPWLGKDKRVADYYNKYLIRYVVIPQPKNNENVQPLPETGHSFMDTSKYYFAPELEAAVSVWNALFGKGSEFKETSGDTAAPSATEQIITWLCENRNLLDDSSIDRLVSVCMPAEKKRPKQKKIISHDPKRPKHKYVGKKLEKDK